MNSDDEIWFRQLPRRQCRLRTPAPGEFAHTWEVLGDHAPSRRRVLVWRVPKDNPGRRMFPDGLMRIPLILRGDESVENDDPTLLRLLAWHMAQASGGQDRGGFVVTEEVAGQFPGWGTA